MTTDSEDWAAASEELLRAKRDREATLAGQEALVAEVSAILFDADPVGISGDSNIDEYDPEAESILLRMGEAREPEDVQRIAHEVFVHWFDADLAGPPARYAELAQRIWEIAG